jgi:hypothetical protein
MPKPCRSRFESGSRSGGKEGLTIESGPTVQGRTASVKLASALSGVESAPTRWRLRVVWIGWAPALIDIVETTADATLDELAEAYNARRYLVSRSALMRSPAVWYHAKKSVRAANPRIADARARRLPNGHISRTRVPDESGESRDGWTMRESADLRRRLPAESGEEHHHYPPQLRNARRRDAGRRHEGRLRDSSCISTY